MCHTKNNASRAHLALMLIFIISCISNCCASEHIHRLLTTDASKSIISGTGSTTLTLGETGIISVQAMFSDSTPKTSGGDIFMVVLRNECSMITEYYCEPVVNQRPVFNNEIYAPMFDHGNGTYTYEFTANMDGILSASVFLVDTTGIPVEWWANSKWKDELQYQENVTHIDFNWNNGDLYPGNGNSASARYYFYLKGPATGVINFKAEADASMHVSCDGVQFITGQGVGLGYGLKYGSLSMIEDKYYYCRVDYQEGGGTAQLNLHWQYPSSSYTIIPSEAYYYPAYVGSSPFNITVLCPVGFLGYPTYSSCTLTCGNGQRDTGSREPCDDGNNLNGDGCPSDCTQIEINWICNGGTPTSPDVCEECPLGFSPNPTSTSCVSQCGDGVRAGEEQCDDGNTESDDGCSKTCEIEHGFVCEMNDGDTDECYLCGRLSEPNTYKTECDPISLTTEAISTGGACLGLALVGFCVNIANAYLSNSSSQSALSSVNMMQLLLLLPLIGAYIPQNIIQFLVSIKISAFSFPFYQLSSLPLISIVARPLNIHQSNSYLILIGLESGSAIVNVINLLWLSCLLPSIHLLIFCMGLCTRKGNERKCFPKFIKKCLKSMTFGAYIRLFYEQYMFIALSIMIESKTNKLDDLHEIISFLILILTILL